MVLISEEYRSLNRELHERRADYGTTAPKYSGQVAEMASVLGATSILDYGCGKGLLGAALSHLLIAEYDPAIPGKDEPPEPADLVVSIDVMEHIEPDHLDDVLDDLQRLAIKGVFVTVATYLAAKTLADGRNAHLIVEGPEFWLPKFMERFDLRLFQATANEFAVFAQTKERRGDNGG